MADGTLGAGYRPQRWVVEVPLSKDMGKEAALVAVREAEEMGPFVELVMVAVLTDMPSRPQKGSNLAPWEAEKLQVEGSVLRPFCILAETKAVRSSSHVEIAESQRQGLCDAVIRFQAARLYLNTKKSFSLLKRTSATLSFMESNLPQGVTVVVVKGGKKDRELLTPGTLTPDGFRSLSQASTLDHANSGDSQEFQGASALATPRGTSVAGSPCRSSSDTSSAEPHGAAAAEQGLPASALDRWQAGLGGVPSVVSSAASHPSRISTDISDMSSESYPQLFPSDSDRMLTSRHSLMPMAPSVPRPASYAESADGSLRNGIPEGEISYFGPEDSAMRPGVGSGEEQQQQSCMIQYYDYDTTPDMRLERGRSLSNASDRINQVRFALDPSTTDSSQLSSDVMPSGSIASSPWFAAISPGRRPPRRPGPGSKLKGASLNSRAVEQQLDRTGGAAALPGALDPDTLLAEIAAARASAEQAQLAAQAAQLVARKAKEEAQQMRESAQGAASVLNDDSSSRMLTASRRTLTLKEELEDELDDDDDLRQVVVTTSNRPSGAAGATFEYIEQKWNSGPFQQGEAGSRTIGDGSTWGRGGTQKSGVGSAEGEEAGATRMSTISQSVSQMSSDGEGKGGGNGCRHFSPAQLREATGNFAPQNLLGRGSYGPVFRGQLMGCDVAVKRLEGRGQGTLEFRTEVDILSRVRHPHVVLLMGHCPEDSSLVYEFLPGGSLHQRLHPSPGGSSRPRLQWPDRLRILSEIASALLFLHRHDPPIIHRDLKPDNVLLDHNDVSKISDVGLARLVHDGRYECSMKGMGTVGFIDPEMMRTGEISVKADIFALGVIILMLLTGLKSAKQVHALLLQECELSQNDESGSSRNMRQAVRALAKHLDSQAGSWDEDMAKEALAVAVRCVERHSQHRPDLEREVLPCLKGLAKEARELRDQQQQQQQGSSNSMFICPMSKQLMSDPAVAADGFTYERRLIEEWLQTRDVSPVTGQPLPNKTLAPNNVLKELIRSRT